MILFFISFIAGILTVLAPCVLPLLPVIVGGSLTGGGWRRAYTICVSLGGSVILFTLILKATTALIAVPQAFWNILSGGILVLFGLVMLFPALWDSLGFVNLLNRSSNRALASGYQRNSFWGDMLMGAALGPVFSSCSPTYFVILATVLPASFFGGLLDLIAYAVGLSGFLLVIAIVGQRLVDRLDVAIEPGGWFRRSIGILFIIVGLGVLTGYEAQLEAWLLNRGFDATAIEQRLLGAKDTDVSATSTATLTEAEKAKVYKKAPELVTPDGYINTDGQPITIGQFKGKDVVLLDIWTYSCINCQRTLPYIKEWYD
ncbi:MAG: sulfite exporter TauE/SafE family protein, partial [Candidatus Kaiserbacteria bacterium]|nr:sulfite exporter TauE/SafE family protein [Candidatus Kaiserbacteria bacterium]